MQRTSREKTPEQLGITEKQWDILNEFKQEVCDAIKPSHDDYYMVKWLKARNFDVFKAEVMFRQSMNWRDDFGTDRLLTEYEAPEVLEKYWTGGTTGYDSEGRPLFLMACKGMDFKGIFRSTSKTDLHKFHIKRMLRLLEIGKKQTQKIGKQIDQTTVVADMTGLSLKQFFVPGIDQMYEVLRIYESNFPEFLGAAYIINAPRIFPIVFNVLKPFMSEDTKRKVHIFGSDWKSKLLGKFIEADQLPVSWGGTQVDEDGDESCKSKVIYGSEVPKFYYLKEKGLLKTEKTVKLNVRRGSSKRLEFVTDEKNCALNYAFQTDNHDIGFGIFRAKNPKDAIKDMTPLVLPRRLNCHLVPESGSLRLTEIGLYLVIFDNSYSWTKSKNVYYDIELIRPDKSSNLKEEELVGVTEDTEEMVDCFENWDMNIDTKSIDTNQS